MTNYERYKDDIEKLEDKGVAFDKFKNKIVKCVGFACRNCAFYENYDECRLNAMKWAAEEYKEPEIDWSKVPIDTPVLVSNDKNTWVRRHFATPSLPKDNYTVRTFVDGKTSWSSEERDFCERWRYAKLEEVE